jgi:hypothetical protein
LPLEEAATNWDQGFLKLDMILEAVDVLTRRRRLKGMDVCGDYSEPRFGGIFRSMLSLFDRPRDLPALADGASINAASNRRIIDGVKRILA